MQTVREGKMETQLKQMRRRSPHIGDYSGALKDYNGVGSWSVEGIQERYRKHAEAAGTEPLELAPKRSFEGGQTWVYPLMDQIIERIELRDSAAIEIGIEFIQEDDFFVFGRILKSNTARALRRVPLTEDQQARIRERLVAMLLCGQVPREWHEYKRLLRVLGLGPLWSSLETGVDRSNRYVMRYYDYLDRYARR